MLTATSAFRRGENVPARGDSWLPLLSVSVPLSHGAGKEGDGGQHEE